jgi:hypothetical protein
MTDKRQKDANWIVTNADGTVTSWEQVQAAVLMDIRDELKRLNNVLQCPNFIAVPSKLDAIKSELRQVRLNTRKRRKLKAVGKPKLRVVR